VIRVRINTFVGALLVLLAVTAVACQGGGDGGSADGNVQEVRVRMTDQVSFEPATITVDAGQPVRLEVDNVATGSIHDFTVLDIAVTRVEANGGSTDMGHGAMGAGEFALHIALDPESEGVLEFTPLEEGEYRFVCTVAGHEGAGMVGTLIVEAADLS